MHCCSTTRFALQHLGVFACVLFKKGNVSIGHTQHSLLHAQFERLLALPRMDAFVNTGLFAMTPMTELDPDHPVSGMLRYYHRQQLDDGHNSIHLPVTPVQRSRSVPEEVAISMESLQRVLNVTMRAPIGRQPLYGVVARLGS